MLRRALILLLLAASPALAAPALDGLPKRVQDDLWEMIRACNAAGGRPGDPMRALEAVDLDGDGTPDLVLDEARFPCAGLKAGALCPSVGCSTYVTLSDRGRWRPALDVVGGYCIDRAETPARFMTVQKQYLADGGGYILNVRYRFRNGMAFQDGRGRC
ncbi:hypothetical protein [Salinarimonas soli]|uniref:Uncharacterized protein n=1 Tax=Salinarimonas soli TaxID=1638099 RepID=A0A5B2V8R9_9HYPH|nr:hypothetical protein [Salinarimonas soli]KAA2235381.1 hypothetical protein F0L46_20445 [Salinarimonas soli]